MYAVILRVCKFLVRRFYRDRRMGAPVPATGPLILVGNHTNGLVDGVYLMSVTERPVRFLAKFTLFKMPVLGTLVKCIGAVKIYRKKDNLGEGLKELNEGAFDDVFRKLAAGEIIGIFPEGSSHSSFNLQRLKTGAARLALGAEAAAGWGLGVRIVPVGFLYEDRDAYGSRVEPWVGDPVAIDGYRAAFEADEWQASEALTGAIADALRGVTVNLETPENRPLLALAERVCPADDSLRLTRLQVLARGLEALRRSAPERWNAFAQRAASFEADFAAAPVVPAKVRSLPVLFVRVVQAFGVGLPLLVACALLFGPPVLVAWAVPRLARAPLDKRVTFLLLAAAVLVPLWSGALLLFAAGKWGWGVAAALALTQLALGYLAPILWSRRRQALAELRLLLRPSPRANFGRESRAICSELEDLLIPAKDSGQPA